MDLRDYQIRAIELARAARRDGTRRILLSSPTGSGKTRIACAMISRASELEQRILVIAHRRELLDQFFGAIYALGLRDVGLMRAEDERTNAAAPIQLASIATLIRRDLPPADLIFVDEAHRTPSESYSRILARYPDVTIIGLTATPCRLDGEPLKGHYDTMIQVSSYSELIDAGWIRAPIVYAPRVAPDLSKVRRVGGDYDEGQLEGAMLAPHVVGSVVDEWRAKAHGRSTVVFAVGIAHSKEIARRFTNAGVRCAHIDGTTSEDDRLETLLALQAGAIEVVTNVGVLCEGWDQPRAKCCVMARPTLSLTLYMQCVGRILRPWGDLPPVVLDHAGNTARHGLPHEDRAWSLDGRPERASRSTHHVCGGCFAYVDASPCPICGYAALVTARRVREAEGTLEPVASSDAAKALVDPRRATFDKALERARHEGFVPGYAAAKFKQKYGAWPPWDWSVGARRAFSADPQWQADVERRTASRNFWKAKNEEKLRQLEAQPAVWDPDSPDGAA